MDSSSKKQKITKPLQQSQCQSSVPATKPETCQEKTEVYARVCGFMRPVQQWNKGKKEEFKDRRMFDLAKAGVRDSH